MATATAESIVALTALWRKNRIHCITARDLVFLGKLDLGSYEGRAVAKDWLQFQGRPSAVIDHHAQLESTILANWLYGWQANFSTPQQRAIRSAITGRRKWTKLPEMLRLAVVELVRMYGHHVHDTTVLNPNTGKLVRTIAIDGRPLKPADVRPHVTTRQIEED